MCSHEVKDIRERLGWTQKQMEEFLGSASHRVSFWERTKNVTLHQYFTDQLTILNAMSKRKPQTFTKKERETLDKIQNPLAWD